MTQLKIVGRKYFKPEKGINLLTWSEKEQIRYLHDSDQDTWTVEKLAESFPASEMIIMKVLKSKWRPRDADRVLKHDLAVQKNWDMLWSGNLEVDPEMKVHLSQFTQRTVPASQRPDIAEMFEGAGNIPKPKQSEFGNIIASYQSLKCKDIPENDIGDTAVLQRSCDTSVVPEGGSFVLHGGKSYSQHGRTTLEKYRQSVLKAIKKGSDTSSDARLMVSRHSKCQDVPEAAEEASSDVTSTIDKDCPAGLNSSVSKTSPDLTADPPEWIQIPASKWQKGGTFKVGDCYYDDDGTFLYRVPGMK
ncbi:uncharacterized protein LOC110837925 isoform X2 [Zootermopsis nevadensis]|nr:uncharacterized protein LOC110837925 isoform X2 [Zootermopsis nevadensis]